MRELITYVNVHRCELAEAIERYEKRNEKIIHILPELIKKLDPGYYSHVETYIIITEKEV